MHRFCKLKKSYFWFDCRLCFAHTLHRKSIASSNGKTRTYLNKVPCDAIWVLNHNLKNIKIFFVAVIMSWVMDNTHKISLTCVLMYHLIYQVVFLAILEEMIITRNRMNWHCKLSSPGWLENITLWTPSQAKSLKLQRLIIPILNY